MINPFKPLALSVLFAMPALGDELTEDLIQRDATNEEMRFCSDAGSFQAIFLGHTDVGERPLVVLMCNSSKVLMMSCEMARSFGEMSGLLNKAPDVETKKALNSCKVLTFTS